MASKYQFHSESNTTMTYPDFEEREEELDFDADADGEEMDWVSGASGEADGDAHRQDEIPERLIDPEVRGLSSEEQQAEWDRELNRISKQPQEQVQQKLRDTAARTNQAPAPGTGGVGQSGPSSAAAGSNDSNMVSSSNPSAPGTNTPAIIDAYDAADPLPRHMMRLYVVKPNRYSPSNGVGIPNQITMGDAKDIQFCARLVLYHLLGARNNLIAQRWTDAPCLNSGAQRPLHNKSSIICNRFKKARKVLRLGLHIGQGPLKKKEDGEFRVEKRVQEFFEILDSRPGQLEEAVYHNCTWPIDHQSKTFSAPSEVKAVMDHAGIVGGDVLYPVEAPSEAHRVVRELLDLADLTIISFDQYLADHSEYDGYEPDRHNPYWVEARDTLPDNQ